MSDPQPPGSLAQLRHDLRTPINHILGYGELLEEDLRARGVTQLEDLGHIQTAARQLLGLIETSLSGETLSLAPSILPDHFPSSFAALSESNDLPAPIPGHLLIVDDNAENRDVLAKRLEKQGHRVTPADNGLHALELLETGTFDLVLLDVMMPGMDGYAVLTTMKASERWKHIPVIMISALDEIESVVRCIEAGAEEYLPKPFNSTLLRARIGASLEKKKFRDQEQAYLGRIKETQERLENELQEAARYVASILPPPMESPFQISWAYDPSTELGGDSFGYHWIDKTHFAIYLLDVCGHGVGAALLSVAAINVIRSSSLPKVDFRNPGEVLGGLNDAFQMERHNNMYFTIWYGVYDTATRLLRHASGGHPPAILLRAGAEGNDVTEELRCPGVLIGAMPSRTFKSETTAVPKDARLFVFCDGAYEIKQIHGEMLDFEKDFVSYLQRNGRSPTLPEDLLSWVRSIRGQQTLDDDYSFVAIDFPA